MPWGLKRYYGAGHLHFITCSCYNRQPLLGTPQRRDLFLKVLEQVRKRYQFVIVGYVVMPEHFHLLVSEPQEHTPSLVMQALKLGFARRVLAEKERLARRVSINRLGAPGLAVFETWDLLSEHPRDSHHIWQPRFYDFNVWSPRKRAEKLRYMHENPIRRGLVRSPEEWRWSSYRAYAYEEHGPVLVNEQRPVQLKWRGLPVA